MPAGSSLRRRVAWNRVLHVQIYFDFLRLFGHGHGAAACLGFQFPRELPLAVRRRPRAGVLAPGGHDAIRLVPRLRLRAARRPPQVQRGHPQPRHHLSCAGCGMAPAGRSSSGVLFHGAFLVLERLGLATALIETLPALLRHAYLLLVVVIGWVFFRSETIAQAWAFLQALAGKAGSRSTDTFLVTWHLTPELWLALAAAALGAMPVEPPALARPREAPLRHGTARLGLGGCSCQRHLARGCPLALNRAGRCAHLQPVHPFRF